MKKALELLTIRVQQNSEKVIRVEDTFRRDQQDQWKMIKDLTEVLKKLEASLETMKK